MTDSTQTQQTNQAVTGEPNQPPAQQQPNTAPPPPPPSSTNYDGAFASLQQSVDGLSETFINGMKEAFPVLSQPPQAAAAQADQANSSAAAAQVDTGNAGAAESDKDSRSWLARKWFG